MSIAWSAYIIALVAVALVGCAWLLAANRSAPMDGAARGDSMGHDYDGIEELNNPLPAWWSWLFWITLVFAAVYLLLYPGLGSFSGWLGWTSRSQYEAEVGRADTRYGPIFASYFARPIPDLLGDERAVEMGARLFAHNCATCHGSDARGGPGYPNLTDRDWLYGGDPDTIVQTITHGRIGNMPGLGPAIGGEQGVKNMAQYVLSLSGREHDAAMAASAAETFQTICAVCHGPEGRGNQAIGAPNLTDDIWLHRGQLSDIELQIEKGRINQMPAHANILSEQKIHLLALYVFSLSADSNTQ